MHAHICNERDWDNNPYCMESILLQQFIMVGLLEIVMMHVYQGLTGLNSTV